ncbi:MAG: tetratricopeptide repeat protein [Cytophagales bacterium]|nr:MAG: tetratricopeptide repeat protein [Cytophagales bacterium]
MRYLCLLIILFITSHSAAQQSKTVIDSLLKRLPTDQDSNKVNTLNALSYQYINTNPTQARKHAEEALKFAQSISYQHGIASSIDLLGTLYEQFGDYAKALEYKLKALRIYEQSKDIGGIAKGFNNIGVLYYRQKNLDKALEYYEKALEIVVRQNRKSAIAVYMLNIGEVYQEKGEYAKAIEYEQKSMEISKNLQYMDDCVAFSMGIIGQCYAAQGKYDKAIANMQQTVKIFEKIGDKTSVTEYLIDLGNVYIKIKQYEKAIQHFEQGLKIIKTIDYKDWERDANFGLSQVYALQKNFEKAYFHHQEYNRLKDIIFNEKNAKEMTQMQSLYESDKKEAEIEMLTMKNKISEEESRVAKLFSYFFLSIFLFAGGLLFLLYKNNRSKQKANLLLTTKNNEIELKNAELEQQKEEILTQRDLLGDQNITLQKQQIELQERNDEIEKQRNDITASITYAKRIQTAILPDIDKIKEILPNSFIFYKPRDIVSGDFYYFTTLQDASVRYHDGSRSPNTKIVLAAVDCTGHGVPGAFMSMIGDAMLNQIINIQRVTSPDIILNELHKGVRMMLKQQEGENRDGMDISICTIDLGTRTLEFAGARNSLYLIQENDDGKATFEEIKADKISIGGYQHEENRIFTKNIIHLDKPTTFYLASDGYKDQFGNKESKKFSPRRFREMLHNIHQLDMEKQHYTLANTFEEWKGNEPQIDDVLVIGVKI